MNDENALRIKAREAMRSGKLPGSKPTRMSGGHGSGACCTICSETVGVEELGFELEFESEENGEDTHYIHLRCFAAWEFERRQFEVSGLVHVADVTSGGHKQATGVTAGVLSECTDRGTICIQNERTVAAPKRDNSSRGGAA